MEIPTSEIYNTALSFVLKGDAASHLFPVRTKVAERIQACLGSASSEPAGLRQFAVFETTNGWTVAVRLDMVEAMHLLSDPLQHELEYDPAETGLVRFHFGAEREPLELAPIHAEEVTVLANDLDDGLETTPRRFISLIDEDDEGLYVGMQHVLLVEMETACIAEGQRIIDGQMER